VTATVHKDFLSFFWILFDFFDIFLTWREHVWASWILVELVARPSTSGAHNRTAALLDRETGPDLTWQWTLAVLVCAALARVFQKRK
jgi:hypothetical protein